MPEFSDVFGFVGHEVVDRSGERVGRLDEICLDPETKRPQWGRVHVAVHGKTTFVPLAGASPAGDQLRIAYERHRVIGAPPADPSGQLSMAGSGALYRYWGPPPRWP